MDKKTKIISNSAETEKLPDKKILQDSNFETTQKKKNKIWENRI